MAKKVNAKDRREASKPKYGKKQNAQNKTNNVASTNSKDNKNTTGNVPVILHTEIKKAPQAMLKDAINSRLFTLRVKLLSPLHLGSGEEDVVIDAEIVHDECGIPYFPGKRLKGLLYESALEVAEMLELLEENHDKINALFNKNDVDKLFQRGCLSDNDHQLIVPNLYFNDYDNMKNEWLILQKVYPEQFHPIDVLEQYTSIRYQTKIDKKTGVAADTSLHNMRVLNSGLEFMGNIEVRGASKLQMEIIALAVRNLNQAGMKRNRGFGQLMCFMENNGKDIMKPLVQAALKEGGLMR